MGRRGHRGFLKPRSPARNPTERVIIAAQEKALVHWKLQQDAQHLVARESSPARWEIIVREITEREIFAAQEKALVYWNLQQEAQREAERQAQRRAPPPDVGGRNGAAAVAVAGASAFEDAAETHQ